MLGLALNSWYFYSQCASVYHHTQLSCGFFSYLGVRAGRVNLETHLWEIVEGAEIILKSFNRKPITKPRLWVWGHVRLGGGSRKDSHRKSLKVRTEALAVNKQQQSFGVDANVVGFRVPWTQMGSPASSFLLHVLTWMVGLNTFLQDPLIVIPQERCQRGQFSRRFRESYRMGLQRYYF